jgi:mono/diheme cytochrome c family protein
MVIVIVLFWALIGLGVFFIAMRGGPRGARQSLHTDRPEIGGTAAEGGGQIGQRAVTLGIVLLFAFGLVVPALVLAFNGADKASVAVGGLHLNASQQRGRDLFARSCAVCHTLAAVKSVGRIGPNLDVRVGEDIGGKTPAEHKALAKGLVLDAIEKGRARGLGQMPAQLYQGKEAEEVAEFVATVAGH